MREPKVCVPKNVERLVKKVNGEISISIHNTSFQSSVRSAKSPELPTKSAEELELEVLQADVGQITNILNSMK